MCGVTVVATKTSIAINSLSDCSVLFHCLTIGSNNSNGNKFDTGNQLVNRRTEEKAKGANGELRPIRQFLPTLRQKISPTFCIQ